MTEDTQTEKPEIEYRNGSNHVSCVYFDEDPDGDPDRAGDGWYFRIYDEDDWSGAWQSQTEAESEAIDALFARERKEIEAELASEGFAKTFWHGDDITTLSKWTDGTFYQVLIREHDVVATYTNMVRTGSLFNKQFAPWDNITGHRHAAVREAVEAINEDLGLNYSAPSPR